MQPACARHILLLISTKILAQSSAREGGQCDWFAQEVSGCEEVSRGSCPTVCRWGLWTFMDFGMRPPCAIVLRRLPIEGWEVQVAFMRVCSETTVCSRARVLILYFLYSWILC